MVHSYSELTGVPPPPGRGHMSLYVLGPLKFEFACEFCRSWSFIGNSGISMRGSVFENFDYSLEFQVNNLICICEDKKLVFTPLSKVGCISNV